MFGERIGGGALGPRRTGWLQPGPLEVARDFALEALAVRRERHGKLQLGEGSRRAVEIVGAEHHEMTLRRDRPHPRHAALALADAEHGGAPGEATALDHHDV